MLTTLTSAATPATGSTRCRRAAAAQIDGPETGGRRRYRQEGAQPMQQRGAHGYFANPKMRSL